MRWVLELQGLGKTTIWLPEQIGALDSPPPIHSIRIFDAEKPDRAVLEMPVIPGILKVINLTTGILQLTTRTPCFFHKNGSADGWIEAEWKISRTEGLEGFKVGSADQAYLFAKLDSEAVSAPDAVRKNGSIENSALMRGLSNKLSWERPEENNYRREPELRLSWHRSSPEKPLLPVFESGALPGYDKDLKSFFALGARELAKLLGDSVDKPRARLMMFGHWLELASPQDVTDQYSPVRFLQIPTALADRQGITGSRRGWYVGIHGIRIDAGLRLWRNLVGRVGRAAELVRPSEPATHLALPLLDLGSGNLKPKLGTGSAKLEWNWIYRLDELLRPKPELEAWSYDFLGYPKSLEETGEGKKEVVDVEVRSWSATPRITGSVLINSQRTFDLEVELPGLETHAGSQLQGTITIVDKEKERVGKAEQDLYRLIQAAGKDPGLWIWLDRSSLFRVKAEKESDRRLRFGSLDLLLGSNRGRPGEDGPDTYMHLLLVPELELDEDAETASYRIEGVDVVSTFSLAAIGPGGQDGDLDPFPLECSDDEGQGLEEPQESALDRWRIWERSIECAFKRARPLIVPDPFGKRKAGQQEEDPLLLIVNETRRPREGLRLELGIHSLPGRADGAATTEDDPCGKEPLEKADRVLVIDPDPFFAGLVAYEPLGRLGDPSQTAEIANWRNHGLGAGAWHLHLPSRLGFCLTLPPQGVGETMERYQTLGDDEPADFRLAPPARLSMRATYFEQSFPEAPWNLRRLLTRPGRELPGAELERAHLELLYGLSCHMDMERDLVRLAEVLTLVGGFPGPLPRIPNSTVEARWLNSQDKDQQLAHLRYRLRWSRLHAQMRARLAVFEAWDPGRLSTLRRREGVRCWIRVPEPFYEEGKAPDRPKILEPLGSADLAHPIDSLVPPSKSTDPHPPDKPAADGALRGGVTWGFESRNVFEATIRPTDETWPQSTTAEISDLRLSALGAWAHQMAAFDNGLTTFYGDVAMGRTYAYRIERLGRIGVFWHRAKHVILYERSVVPSRQFVRDQNDLGGRPVLRKVREYVEILENQRSYPDQGGGVPRQVGFIRRMSFADDGEEVVRFHVKSAWGTDLTYEVDGDGKDRSSKTENGWKVPIWIVGAEPADVFPRPRVRVTALSVVDGETREVERYIDNPENLYFFTRTTDVGRDDKAADTNTWPPVPGVDWVDRPRPRADSDGAFAKGRLTQTVAGDRPVPAGHGPTTFFLEPSPHGVDLTAHRPGDPMASRVATFTMTRSTPRPGGGEPETDPGPAAKLGKAFAEQLARLPAKGPIGKDQRKAVEALVDGLPKTVEELLPKEAGVWGEGAKHFLAKARQDGEKALGETLRRWLSPGRESRLDKALSSVVESLIRDQLSGEDLRKELRIRARREVQHLSQQLALLTPTPFTLSAAVLPALREAVAGIDAIVKDGKSLRGQLDGELDEVLAAPDRLERQARAWLDKIERVVDAAIEKSQSGGQFAVPGDTTGKRLPIPGLGRKILKPVRQTLHERASSVREAVDLLRAHVVRSVRAGQAISAEIGTEVKRRLDDATKGLIDLGKQADGLRKTAQSIEEAIEELDELKIRQLQAFETMLLDKSDEIIDKVIDQINEVSDAQQAAKKVVKDWLEDAENWIGKVIEEPLKIKINSIEAQVKDTFKAQVKDTFEPLVAEAEEVAEKIAQRLNPLTNKLKSKLEKDAADIRRLLEQERDAVLAELEREYGDELRAVEQVKGRVHAAADAGLRLVRAFGEPPEVGGLQFDRPETAFFFKELDEKVGITPVIGRVAQAASVANAVGDVLEPLGIDLPVKELGEKLIPENLKSFDLADIFPNFAGLRLDKLFSGLKMPEPGRDVTVRHGIDRQTRRAWFHAEVDTQIKDNATVFSTGPLTLSIVEPKFWGKVDAQIDASGAVRRKVEGTLKGNWRLTIGGTLILVIRQSTLFFDDRGRLRYEIRPEQIELPETLRFINDLLSAIAPDIDGLTLKIEPTGVSAILCLPLPDMQGGAFGIAGLALGATLALRWVDFDSRGRQGFSIGLAFNLAHPSRPFTLTVFVLGGAGYLTVNSRYFPTTGDLTTDVRLAIMASASLAISLGPVSGGVYAYFGLNAAYQAGKGGLDIGIVFMIVGRVSVLGIVSASLHLLLEAQYSNGNLIGRGHIRYKIKICWCFTLKVSASVTYRLAGSGKKKRRSRQGSLGDGWPFAAPSLGPEPVTRVAQLGGPASLPSVLGGAALGAADNDAEQLPPADFAAVQRLVDDYLDMLV